MAAERLAYELIIVGAGPAGLAAADAAAALGAKTALLDMQPALGGQIWRGAANPLIQKVNHHIREGQIDLLSGATVFDVQEDQLLVDQAGQAKVMSWQKLILACGARDLCLPFPGWTLPNVYSVGGLQALIKTGLDIAGKRIAIAGSGPLLLALLKTATEKGAEVVLLAEQARFRDWMAFGHRAAMLKPTEPLGFLGPLINAGKLRWSAWPVAVTEGRDLTLTLQTKKGLEGVPCDIAAVSYGLIPNLELAALLGCQTTPDAAITDRSLQTTRPGVYAAGEQLGIAGAECAVIEGRIAALSALGQDAQSLIRRAERHQALRQVIRDRFALQPALLEQHRQQNPVFCRCENVRLEGWQGRSFAEIKLQTRIGMGPCQGRFCGAAHQALYGRGVESPRPPIFPVLAGTYAQALGALREEGIHAKD